MNGDTQFDGRIVAETLEKFNSGAECNNAELRILNRGLGYLVGFCATAKLTPLTSYYAGKLSTVGTILKAREEDKNS